MDFKIGPPFRPPCGGWINPPMIFLGPLYRHILPSDLVNVGVYLNVTVTSPMPADGSWIGGDPGQFTLVAGYVNSIINTWANTPGDVMNFVICYKSGFKNVCANRMWHGMNGFSGHNGCIDSYCTPWTGTQWASYQGSYPQTRYCQVTLSMTGSYSYSNTSDAAADTGSSFTWTDAVSINPLSGEVSHNESYSLTQSNPANLDTTFTGEGNITLLATGMWACAGIYEFDITAAPTNWLLFYSDWVNTNGPINTAADMTAFLNGVAAAPDGLSTGSGSANLTEEGLGFSVGWSGSGPVAGGTQTESFSFEFSLSLSGANTSAAVLADAYALLKLWDLTDDHQYPWRTSGLLSTAPLVSRNELPEVTNIEFLQTNTMPDMTNPIADASGNAPFSTGWAATYGTMAWKDLNAWNWHWKAGYEGTWADQLILLFDGSILGAPKPAGYQNAFEFQFVNYNWDGTEWNVISHGMYLDAYNAQIGGDLPETATQWANNYFIIGTPPGASLRYNDPTQVGQNGYSGGPLLGGLVAYKYCEILERWNSYSFARPCGADKFNYDETQVYRANNITGSGPGATLTLTNWMGEAVTLSDYSGAWGGPCVGGFYAIELAAGTVTLGNLLFAIPTGWKSASGDDDTCFGLLRFSSCPSLAGRQSVTSAGTTVTFTTSQPYFGIAASGTEQVDLYDSGMNLIAGNVPATRINDSSFSVATAVPNVAWVTIVGVTYYFDDNYPKGDFLYHTWLFDFRTNQEYNRIFGANPPTTAILNCSGTPIAGPTLNNGYADYQTYAGCLPFKPCCPAVVCFSPNAEVFPNGLTVAMPTDFQFDAQYGSRWQGVPQQVMDDPLWQKPHLPCDGTDPIDDVDGGDSFTGQTITFVQDNGLCAANTVDPDTGLLTVYYAFPPQVEARNSLPTNYGLEQNQSAPALPDGVSITPDSPVTYPAAANPNYPPAYIGFNGDGTPATFLAPWILRQRFCNAAGCRFNYSAPNCPNV